MHYWNRLIVFGAVVLLTLVIAWLIDRRMSRRDLPPAVETRYRILRRSVVALIVFVGLLSGLLVIPPVRAVATGILASSAVIGLIVGFAAQRTLGNFIAGLLIAFAQPLRLGDHVEIAGYEGVVEEIGLTYTFIRTADDDRIVIPNERIASDTIRNSTIRGRRKLARRDRPGTARQRSRRAFAACCARSPATSARDVAVTSRGRGRRESR